MPSFQQSLPRQGMPGDAGQIGRTADLHGSAARRVRDKDVPNAPSAMDGNSSLCRCLIQGINQPADSPSCDWIPAVHAGMTGFNPLCITTRAGAWEPAQSRSVGTGKPAQGKPCTPSAASSACDADLRLGVGRQPFAANPFPNMGVVPLSAWGCRPTSRRELVRCGR